MSDQGDYFTRSEEAASVLADALGEIIRLNQEARETKERTSREYRQREAELVASIEAQANVIEDQKHAILVLELQLSITPTTRPQRHVAEEMGLRGGMATAAGLVAEKDPNQK